MGSAIVAGRVNTTSLIQAVGQLQPPADAARRGISRSEAGFARRTFWRTSQRKSERVAVLRQLVAFRFAYRDARLRFAAGEHHVLFPAGTYRLRFAAAARCAPFPIPITA